MNADANRLLIIGQSKAFLTVMQKAAEAARVDRPVLILGERGTGKELIAARLHYLSRRWEGPRVTLNCAAMPPELLDTELFGHEKGAYTGAFERKAGRIELADGGTLFLDEIGLAPVRLQEKILRVVEYGEFERVGGTETLKVNVRVLAATNLDPRDEVKAGRFREDLLDRLSFEVITLPPLRERKEDIPLLAGHFLGRMAAEMEHKKTPVLSPKAIEQLLNHEWPGNVRELKNAVERSLYRAKGNEIEEILLDPFDSPYLLKPANAEISAEPQAQLSGKRPSGKPDAQNALAPRLPINLDDHLKAVEKEIIEKALEQCRHNQAKAAKLLGLSYHQLRSRMRKREK